MSADGNAIPYGVYDLTENAWAPVGVDHDTSGFAVATIDKWWQSMGMEKYPDARMILMAAAGGGSKGTAPALEARTRTTAAATGLEIIVSHYPPCTSKWNKIEHRLFSRSTPQLARTTTRNIPNHRQAHCQHHDHHGMTVHCEFDHGDWNYTIEPQKE